ncbi:transmembrane and immunoglobulin domain-containing protein 1 [Mixophyes fleayi]|uniref:transmembrane and immunoglobulin domain-containing protein 1 n=1 Tax=Mixophyes fleayi TaxID=3061075 RepID=UPI003F4DD5B1
MKKFILVLLLSLSYLETATTLQLLLNNITTNGRLSGNVSDSATMRCEVVDNTADETLMWYRGTQQVDIKSENSVNISYVCIEKLTAEDHGVSFTCLLKSNTSMKLSVQLFVLFDPILTGDQQMFVEEGKDVQITCGFKANPAATMFWRQNNSVITLPSNFEEYMTTDSLQLTIKKAEKANAAYYSCVALLTNGTEVVQVIELIVEDRKVPLPVEAIAAAVVVGALVIAFGLFARRDKIIRCKKSRDDTAM